MAIADYCRKDVCTVAPAATLREAAERMAAAGTGCAVVVAADGQPLGVLTDRDLALRILCDHLDPGGVRVEELRLPEPVMLRLDQPLVEAARCLRRHRFRRLPVVTDTGALAGIVAADDLLQVVAAELAGLAAAVARQLGNARA